MTKRPACLSRRRQLTIAEGGSDSYEVVLTSQPAHDVTVTITHSGDGDIGNDHQELTFTGSDWETAQTVTVSAAQDDDARDDVATLSHSVASTDGDYNGVTVSEVEVTATDDETAGVSILPEELTIAEGGSDSYRVVLTSKPSHEVTVTINHGGDNDIDSDPDRLTFSPSNWNQEKTVTVTSAQDDDARDDTATLSHTVSSTDGDYNGITVPEVDVTATDDETAGVSIRPEELTITEGGSDSYQVFLTSQPAHDVTVTISYSGDQDKHRRPGVDLHWLRLGDAADGYGLGRPRRRCQGRRSDTQPQRGQHRWGLQRDGSGCQPMTKQPA